MRISCVSYKLSESIVDQAKLTSSHETGNLVSVELNAIDLELFHYR